MQLHSHRRASNSRMNGIVITLLLFLFTSVAVGQTLTTTKLEEFLTSSVKLKTADKDVAKYLERVKLTSQMPPNFLVEMKAIGIGPRTEEALKKLAARSASLPPAPELKPAERAAPPSRKPPTKEEQERLLKWMREYATNYDKNLPDFICVQVTRRYADPTGMELWQKQDTVTAKLSYYESRENYEVILVNSRPVQNVSLRDVGGSTSTGEFGSLLREIFDPKSQARFRWLRYGTLRGRLMHVFFYQIDRENSEWSMRYEDMDPIVVAHEGLIYVDHDSELIMRIAMQTRGVPVSYPLSSASTTLDYDFTKIGEQEFVLPLRAEVRMRAAKLLSKNEVEFRLYRKYSADTVITFDTEGLEELDASQTQEQEVPPEEPTNP
jgi:hypothetical protein